VGKRKELDEGLDEYFADAGAEARADGFFRSAKDQTLSLRSYLASS
jgi:hypothetical protein